MLKRSEHRFAKREFIREEYRNQYGYMDGHRALEALSELCAESYGEAYRCHAGRCNKSPRKGWHRMDFYCNSPALHPTKPSEDNRHKTKPCGRGQICETLVAHNYAGYMTKFPYCKSTLKINKRPAARVEVPPRFQGETSLPNPEETWQISDAINSPGTLDTHYHLAAELAGLQASWEYRGHWKNGWSFLTESQGMASSFSCLGCPQGTLYAETVGFNGEAEGFTFPHSSY